MEAASLGAVMAASRMAARSSEHEAAYSAPPAAPAVPVAPGHAGSAQDHTVVASAPVSGKSVLDASASEEAVGAEYVDPAAAGSMHQDSLPKKDWDYPVVERMLEVRARPPPLPGPRTAAGIA